MQYRTDSNDIQWEGDLDNMTLLELWVKELQLHFWAVPDLAGEDISKTVLQSLAQLIDWEEDWTGNRQGI